MQNEDTSRRRKFYDQLSEAYDLGSFEEFDQKMNSPESREKLWKYIDGDGQYDIGDFNYFDEAMRPVETPVSETPQQPTAAPQAGETVVPQPPTQQPDEYPQPYDANGNVLTHNGEPYSQEVLRRYYSPDNKAGNFRDLATIANQVDREQSISRMQTTGGAGYIPPQQFPIDEQPKTITQEQDEFDAEMRRLRASSTQGDEYQKLYGKFDEAFKNGQMGGQSAYAQANAIADEMGMSMQDKQDLLQRINKQYAKERAAESVQALMEKMPERSADPLQALQSLYYDRDLQQQLMQTAAKMGNDYQDYINMFVKPQLIEAMKQKYGGTDQDWNGVRGLFSNWQHVGERLENQEVGGLLSEHFAPAIDEAINKAYDEALGVESQHQQTAQDMPQFSQGNMGALVNDVLAKKKGNEIRDPKVIRERFEKALFGDMSGEGGGGGGSNDQMLNLAVKEILTDENLSGEILGRAEKAGMTTIDYIKKYVIPQMVQSVSNQFEKAFIEREMPKSTAEYILKGLTEDNVIMMLANRYMRTEEQQHIANEADALTAQGENPNVNVNTLTQGARLATGMAADFWMWGGWGKIGAKATGEMLAQRVAERAAADHITIEAAKRLIEEEGKQFLGKGVVEGMMRHIPQSAITMAGAEATATAAQGIRDREDAATIIGNTLGSAVSGATTGTMFGVTGGAMGRLTSRLTGPARLAGKLAGFGVEASTMYTAEELQKMAMGEDTFQNPIDGLIEAGIKLGFIKASANPLATGVRLIEAVRHPVKSLKAAMTPDNSVLTEDDVRDIQESQDGAGLMDALTRMRPARSTDNGEREGYISEADAEIAANAYRDYMTNPDRPWDRKQRVAHLLGGLIPPPGHEVTSELVDTDNGTLLRTRDLDGNLIREIKYDSHDEAQDAADNMANDLFENTTTALQNKINTAEAFARFNDYFNEAYAMAADKMAKGLELTKADQQAIYLHQHGDEMLDIYKKIEAGEELSEEGRNLADLYRQHFEGYVMQNKAVEAFNREYTQENGVNPGMLDAAIKGHTEAEARDLAEQNGEGVYQTGDVWRTESEQKIVGDYQQAMRQRIADLEGQGIAVENAPNRFRREDNLLPGNTDETEVPDETEEGGGEPPVPPAGATGGIDESVGSLGQGRDGRRDAAYQRGLAVDDNGTQLAQIGYDRRKAAARMFQQLPDNDPVAARVRNGVMQAVQNGDVEAAEALLEQSAQLLTPEQREAVDQYLDAIETQTGVEDAAIMQTNAFEMNRRKQLQVIADPQGNVTPLLLNDGRTVYYKSGDLDNHYGGVMAVDENGEAVQVSVRQITEIGQPQNVDAILEAETGNFYQQTMERYTALSEGMPLQGQQVDLILSGQPFRSVYIGPDAAGNSVFQLEDGSTITLRPDEAMQAAAEANQAKIQAELKAEQEAAAERQQTLQFEEKIKGYKEGLADLSAAETDARTAADYIRKHRIDGGMDPEGSRQQQLRLIDHMKEQMAQRREETEKELKRLEQWLRGNEDITDPSELYKITERKTQLRNTIADLAQRQQKWTDIRLELMTPEERIQLEQQRRREVFNARKGYKPELEQANLHQNADLLYEDEKGRLVLGLTSPGNVNNYLLRNFDNSVEAEKFINQHRLDLRNEQRDVIQPEINRLNDQLNQYTAGRIDLTADEIKDAVHQVADLEARQDALSDQSARLRGIVDGIPALYERNRPQQLTPAEERGKALDKAGSREDKLRIAQNVYGRYPEALDVINDQEPRDLDEFIAANLGLGSMNWEGFDVGSRHIVGLQEALFGKNGGTRGIGKQYSTNTFNQYLAATGEGKGFNDIVHALYEAQPDIGDGKRWSTEDISNSLINLLLTAQKPSDISHRVIDNRIAEAEDIVRRQEELDREMEEQAKLEEMQEWAAAHHLDPEEREAFEEFMRMPPTEPEKEMINQILAEYEEKQNTGSEGVDSQHPGGAAGADGEAGQVTLQGQGAGGETGGNQEQQVIVGGAEAGNGGAPVPGTDVSGGASVGREVVDETKGEDLMHVPFAERLKAAKGETDVNPTEAQKAAGNYKMGHVRFGSYRMSIENPKGSTRSGVDKDGKPWSIDMKDTYGYIGKKYGTDGDHLDFFINDDADLDEFAGRVFIVDQKNEDGTFDEHKVMYGYPNWSAARQAYERNYEPGWWDKHVMQMTGVRKADFDKWLADSDRKTKPFADYYRTRMSETVSNPADQLLADVADRKAAADRRDVEAEERQRIRENLLTEPTTPENAAQHLADAYRLGDREILRDVADAFREIVKKDEDFAFDDAIDPDEAEGYEGDDPEMLAAQYMVRLARHYFNDYDDDIPYIVTGVKSPKDRPAVPGNIRYAVEDFLVNDRKIGSGELKSDDLHAVMHSQNELAAKIQPMLKKLSDEQLEQTVKALEDFPDTVPVVAVQMEQERRADLKDAMDGVMAEVEKRKQGNMVPVASTIGEDEMQYMDDDQLMQRRHKAKADIHINLELIATNSRIKPGSPKYEQLVKNVMQAEADVSAIDEELERRANFDQYDMQIEDGGASMAGEPDVRQRATKATVQMMSYTGVPMKQVSQEEADRMMELFTAMNQQEVVNYARSQRPDEMKRYAVIDVRNPYAVPKYFEKRKYADEYKVWGNRQGGLFETLDLDKGTEQTEELKKAADIQPQIDVWHGSGAVFTKFDHSFVGTGAKSQSFGWGTYTTGSREIGEDYANLTSEGWKYKGQNSRELVLNASNKDLKEGRYYTDGEIVAFVLRNLNNGYSFDKAVDMVRKNTQSQINDHEEHIDELSPAELKDLEGFKDELTLINSLKPEDFQQSNRNLYKVEIPDDNGSNYLDWEKEIPAEVAHEIRDRIFETVTADPKYGWNTTQDRVRLKTELEKYIFGEGEQDGRECPFQKIYNEGARYLGNSVAGARTVGARMMSEMLSDMGYTGIKYPAGTIYGNGRGATNYVIFNEDDAKIVKHIQFMFDDGAEAAVTQQHTQPIFVSNAMKAVDGISQEKATPEQWLAMIQKNGGLKTGEDKWIGLSDWLKEQKGSVTKQEVMDFIRQNQIQIEEQHYAEETDIMTAALEEAMPGFKDAFNFDVTTWGDVGIEIVNRDKAIELFNQFNEQNPIDPKNYDKYDLGEIEEWAVDEASKMRPDISVKPIESTRLRYTTVGLDNMHEIALTVPTADPYNEDDKIHFGDAGGGRAVAWIRFGDTTDENGNRILVIDEIQSKRHQDAREKGYQLSSAEMKKEGWKVAKYGNTWSLLDPEGKKMISSIIADNESQAWQMVDYLRKERKLQLGGVVPDAPFEKNWHELAMKRMLRYAAENGYDKIAWTTGEQQAKRYNLGKTFNYVSYNKENQKLTAGNIVDGVIDYNLPSIEETVAPEKLADYVGKENALRLIEKGSLTGEDLRIGGEGMKGFYDQMLPRFMDKYGKKWGVKTGTINLPDLEKSAQTMWSIDVTPEMKESVMQGQPMFQKGQGGRVYGWTDGTVIYLTPLGMNPNSPMHEYTHIWDGYIQKHDPKLWKEMVATLKKTAVWQQIRENPNYRAIWEDENRMASEVHSRLTGARSEEEFMKAAADPDNKDADSIIKAVKDVLRRFWERLAQLFGYGRDRLDEFILMPLKDALNGFDPRTGSNTFDPRAMVGWHGSAAKFDRFDHSKIGSGEGQAVSGFGTYVTTSEGTARYYAKVASDRRRKVIQEMGYTLDGKIVHDPALVRAADYLKKAGNNVDEAIKACEHTIEVLNRYKDKNPFAALRGSGKSTAEEAMDYLLHEKEKPGSIGFQEEIVEQPDKQLYEVDIPDDDGKNYLDLDKKLTKAQKAKIKKAFLDALDKSDDADYWKKNRDIIEYDWKYVDSSEGTGDAARGVMEQFLDSEKVSDIFSDLGYKGFKTKGSDGTTYIVFNEDDVKINNRIQFQIDQPTMAGENKPVRSLMTEGSLFSDADFLPEAKPKKGIAEMSDEDLLKEIGIKDGSDRRAYIDEYDRRHDAERREESDAYYDMLDVSNTDKDQALEMYNNVFREFVTSGYATPERTKLNGQIEALESYIDMLDELEAERELEEAEKQESEKGESGSLGTLGQERVEKEPTEAEKKYEQQKQEVRQVGYDLTQLRLRPLEEGETCHVERRYTENGNFSFTGKDKIESIDDVAYIFRMLEDAAIENSFLVLEKDGVPTIIHLGVGNYVGTIAEPWPALSAYYEINPEKVYFIHNHPSGNLVASKQDYNVMKLLNGVFGKKLQPGIIIDTKSGKYGLFGDMLPVSPQTSNRMPEKMEGEVPLKVYSFSRQVFDADWNPETAFDAGTAKRVAEFVSSHRLGKHKKMSLIVMNQNWNVTGNVFLPWELFDDVATVRGADLIARYMNQMGGTVVTLYGNYDFSTVDQRKISFLNNLLKARGVYLNDVIHIDKSAHEMGMVGESEVNESQAGEAKIVEMKQEKPIEETIVKNPNIKEWLDTADRVKTMTGREALEAYKRINSQMLDEDGLNIDEHSAKVKSDYISKHGIKGVGQAMADDFNALSKKYSFGMISLRWDLFDRIEELGLTDYLDKDELPDEKTAEIVRMYRRMTPEIERQNKVFNVNLEKLRKGELDKGFVFEMGMPSLPLLTTGFPNLPIRMQASVLNTKTHDPAHPYDYQDVKDLVKHIQRPLAIFEYGDKDKAQNLMIGISQNVADGKQFLVGISIEPVVKGVKLPYNSIRNVFPKNFHDWIHWIAQGKLLRVDGKKEIQDIIDALRINPVDYIDKNVLNSAANIVKDFENPTISEEKLRNIFKNYVIAAEDTAEMLGGVKVAFESEVSEKGTLGWYDPNDNTLHVVLPEHVDVDDVKRTVFHEKLGHEGLVALLGSQEEVNRFGQFVFKSASKDLRRRIVDKADEEGYEWSDPLRFSKAAQEVLADIAENGPRTADEFSLWRKIKHYLIRFLNRIGLRVRGLLNDHDLAYYILKTGDALKRWNQMPEEQKAAVARQQTQYEIMRSRRGKPRKRNDENMAQYLQRLREWERWKIAEEQARENNDPMPDAEQINEKWHEQFNRDVAEWRRVNNIPEDQEGIGAFPKRGQNETPQEYAARVADYETNVDAWKTAPKLFDYLQRANDEYREAYRAWKERYGIQEQESVDLGLYEGDPERMPHIVDPEDLEADMRAEADLAEAVGIDMSQDGARRHTKISIIERRKNLESSNAEDAIWIHNITNSINMEAHRQGVDPKMLREVMADIIEGTYFEDVIKDEQGNVISVEDISSQLPIKMTDGLKAILDTIKDWYDEFYHVIEDAGLRNGAGYIPEGYVNHVWSKEKSSPDAWKKYVENFQRTKSPNMRERLFKTYRDGEDIGLARKYQDIADILAYYSASNNEAVANRKFLDDLSFIVVEEKNGDGEVVSVLPLLNSNKPNITVSDRYQMYHVPGVGDVWVLKDIQRSFANIFGTMRTGDIPEWLTKTGQVYDTVSSTAKKIELSFSAFHMGALTEVAMAQMRPDRALRALGQYIIFDCAKAGTIPAYAHPEDFKLAASHLVQLGATQDYSAADVNNVTEKIREIVRELAKEENLAKKGAGYAATPIAAALDYINKGMDKVLWNYLHDGLKIACFKMFAEQIEKRVEKQGLSAEQKEQLLDEAGQYVNDTFGGQYWELLNVSPALIKWLRRGFLSPDWLISTQRHFLANFGFGSLYSESGFLNYLRYNADNIKRAFGADIPRDENRRFRSKNAKQCYLLGVCGFFYVMMNALNAMFRAWDEDKEREKAEEMRRDNPDYRSPYELAYPDGMKWYDYTMYGNTIGQQTHLFLGRYDDGTEWYARWGKQFREFPELFMGRHGVEFPTPLMERMSGKANPVGRYLLYDLPLTVGMYGYKQPRETQEIAEKYGNSVALLAMTAKKFLPYSVPTQQDKEFKMFDLVMPSQKGFTRWKAVDYFKTYIQGGDMDGVMRTYNAAVMNGIDAEDCLKAAIATVKATQRKELSDGIVDLQSAMNAYDTEKNTAEKKRLRRKIFGYLAEQNYRAFTRDEAREQVNEFLNGTPEKDNDINKYVQLATSADVRDEYRLDMIRRQAKKFADEVKTEENESRRKKLQDTYGNWLEIAKIIRNANGRINKKKRQLGKGDDDKAIMDEIRRERQAALKEIDRIQAP